MNTTPWYEQGFRNTHETRLGAVYCRPGGYYTIRLDRTRATWDRKKGHFGRTVNESLTITLTPDDLDDLLAKIHTAMGNQKATP